jgi:hypothetical protein
MTEVKVIPQAAEVVYISDPVHSYGIFCFNEQGDLFLNSDWGFYAFAWRSMGEGKTTKQFIAGCNPEYIAMKFGMNIIGMKDRKDYEKYRMSHVIELLKHLIEYCKTS